MIDPLPLAPLSPTPDLVYCPECGALSISAGEAFPLFRDAVTTIRCTHCGSICYETAEAAKGGFSL